MIFNKLANKSFFNKNGYILLNTNLKGNFTFDKLCIAIDSLLKKEIKNSNIKKIKDINFLEGSILILLGLTTIFFGFYPQPLIETMNVSVNNLISNYELDINNYLINFNDK